MSWLWATLPTGFYCDGGESTPTDRCLPGHYCPAATRSFDHHPCSAGTYNPGYSGRASSDCLACTVGHFCEAATPEPQPCPAGSYMPSGATLVNGTLGVEATRVTLCKLACRDTTLEASHNLTDADLRGCEAGCDVPTLEAAHGGARRRRDLTFFDDPPPESGPNCTALCRAAEDAGDVSTEAACAIGCAYFRVSGSFVQTGTSAAAKSDCLACPGGYRCAAATVTPVACGTGRVSDVGDATCATCPAGYTCSAEATSMTVMLNTMACPAGLYCRAGLGNVSEAVPCPRGHYCPSATPEPVNCPVGTYNNETQGAALADCVACDAGTYCLEESILPTGPCAAGYFCPNNITTNEFINGAFNLVIGSYGPRQEPCRGGTYRNTTGARFQGDCDACPIGFYCPPGSSRPVTCPRGFYCPAESSAPNPCPMGTVGTSPESGALDNCTACTPGFFCDREGSWQTTGPCDAGYICYGGASTSTPVDGVTGEVCPAGGYCPPRTSGWVWGRVVLVLVVLFLSPFILSFSSLFFLPFILSFSSIPPPTLLT